MPPVSRLTYAQAPLHPDLQASCVEALRAASRHAPAGRCVLLAPSRGLGLHLVNTHARLHGATFGVHVLTWTELARELSGPERRAAGRGVLSREAPDWLLRRLAERRGRARNHYDALLGKRGFKAVLLRSFDELGRAGLATCRETERFLVRAGMDLPLAVRHALELYHAYRSSFESTHDDAASSLARAAAAPEGRVSEVLGAHLLLVYGFDDLSLLEMRLLSRLASDPGLEIHAFVPLDARDRPALGERLELLGFEAEGSAHDPACSGALQPGCELQAISAPGEESEADEIARAILAAAERGVAFRDMAVITRGGRRLELLRTTLERCGVPCTLSAGRPLHASRAGRALLFWLDLVEAGLTPDAAMSFLQVAPLRFGDWAGIEGDAVPSAWERAARDAFVGTGLDDWRTKLERRRGDLERRAAALDQEGEPAQRARAAARASAELVAVAAALDAEMRRFPERARWSHLAAAAAAFLKRAFEPGREVEALGAALERLHALDLLGGETPRRSEFRDAVRTLLAETPLPDAAAGGGVTLGTAAALYGVDFDLVCVAGLQEGEWPAAALEDPVLLDAERARLSPSLGDPDALPSRARGAARDRRLFWAAVGAARRRLVLGWARLDTATGAARLPSTLLLELGDELERNPLDFAELERCAWVERVPLRRTELPRGGPVLSVAELDALAVAALPGRREASRYVRQLGELERRSLALDTFRNRRARFTAYDGMLTSRAAREALTERFASHPWSATQLATYTTCPFRFFLRHGLRVEPLDRDDRRELSALEVGRLVHTVLEEFYRGLGQEGGGQLAERPFGELRERLLRVASGVFARAEARGQTGAPLLWRIRAYRLREDLVRFLRAECARGEEPWVPRAFELRFGPDTALPARVALPGGGEVALRGSIDRLDAHPAHDGLRVVDYKSGKTVKGATTGPQALQLVVYLIAATGGDPQQLARSEGCFLYVTRRGGFALQKLAGGVVAERAGDVVRLLRDVARGVEGGEMFPHPGPSAVHCATCDYRSVCDARVAEQADFKSRAGQTRRFLELPSFAAAVQNMEVS